MADKNNDLSLILSKAYTKGFFHDLDDTEVDTYTQQAKPLFAHDSIFGAFGAISRAIGTNWVNGWYDTAVATPPTADTPTVAVSATTTTALTSPKVIKPAIVGIGSNTPHWDGQNDSNFHFANGDFRTGNGGSSDLALYGNVKPGGNAQAANWPIIMSFETSSDTIELFCYGGSGEQIMLKVNDHFTSDILIDRSTVTTSGILYTFTFPSAKIRKITLYAMSAGISEVRIKNTAGLWKPKGTVKRKIAIIGDSFVNGAGTSSSGGVGNNTFETFALRLAHLMGGSDDVILAGIGGTGWLAGTDTGGVPNNYTTRLSTILAWNPDIVIFYGSVNDSQTATTTIQSAVESCLAQCVGVPEVYVIGPFSTGWETMASYVKAGVHTYGRTYLDLTGIMFGSGKVGTTTGDGPNDIWRQSDGTHPTLDAHRAITKLIFQAMLSRYGLS